MSYPRKHSHSPTNDNSVVHTDFDTKKTSGIEIDALEMRAIKRRFMALNKDRLKRVQDSLEVRQRMFTELLPLLFHINHPMLPGYQSNKTPCGISDYAPGKRCIQAGRRLARSFTYKRRAQKRYSIHALYMMGSTGTIAYSSNSDFDIWVCHHEDLNKRELDVLRQKADGIESWAASLGLEAHFFLMDDRSFREQKHQQLSNENAGSSQHHLLLDEFYRTGLLIAGRYPVWWLVPPEHENEYAGYVQKLIANRFIKASDIVDFGSLHHLPVEEFFGATLWQLYKAIDSPYKSILKILLMEAYANQYPEIELLSIRFKRSVHQGSAQLDQLDPYVMMCTTVEEYLFERREMDRLDLARRCFYFKVNEPMSRHNSGRDQSWRREAIRDLISTWGWDQQKLESLDQRKQWKIQKVLEERNLLVDELNRSHHSLSRYGREKQQEHHINADDLHLLERKLYIAFERKAGKIEMINPGISLDPSEERLSLHYIEQHEQHGWEIYRGNVSINESSPQTPLKRAASLLDLLTWCHFNGLISNQPTTIGIHPHEGALSQWELRCVLDCLQQLFPYGCLEKIDLQQLSNEATIERAGLLINLAFDPMEKLARNGMQLVSDRIDPLSYGGQWENIAVTFELVAVTSWNEVLTFRYHGHTALLDCMCDYFAWSPVDTGKPPPHLPCFSFSSSRGPIIARRVEQLYVEVREFFYNNYWRNEARYALRIGQHYFVLQCEHNVPRYQEFDSEAALLQHLSQSQSSFSPVRIDNHTLEDSPLPLIMEQNQDGVVQLYLHVLSAQAYLYILDERGSLFNQRISFHDRSSMLGQYQRFLETVRSRMRNMSVTGNIPEQNDVQYFQVVRDQREQYKLKTVPTNTFSSSHSSFDVQVIGTIDDSQHGTFSIYSGDREFSVLEHGKQVFERVAEYILQQRKSGVLYPIHITDIDVHPSSLGSDTSSGIQTIHFLHYKKQVEYLLNEALAVLQKN